MSAYSKETGVKPQALGRDYATCGRCGACRDAAPTLGARRVHVHAFELTADNAAWLRGAMYRQALVRGHTWPKPEAALSLISSWPPRQVLAG